MHSIGFAELPVEIAGFDCRILLQRLQRNARI
jgi:hypothetical protein